MRIRWTALAVAQLEEIEDYIAEDDPIAAYEVVTKILDRVALSLSRHPEVGRPGEHVPGTRELVIPDTPYILVYRLNGDCVDVVRVRHGAQLWPPEKPDA